MLRPTLIVVVLAAIAVLPADASRGGAAQVVRQSLLMPGVGYQRKVEYTPHGPVVLDVVTAPKPDGKLYTLTPSLSNNAVVGTEKLTDLTKEAGTTGTAVGVNADFFTLDPGAPTGMVMRGGVLDAAPASSRSSLGIGADGTLSVAKVGFDGTWRGNDQRRQLDINKAPAAGHTTLYTNAWGPTTPTEGGVVVAVIGALPPTTPNKIVSGVVTQVTNVGPVAIPPGGAVLVSRGNQGPHLQSEAQVGQNVEIRLTLTPNWSAMTGAIGGGPLLVANGKPVFRANESFGDPVLNRRDARSAVGQLPDGRVLLVTVEGGNIGYSSGMTNYELAGALANLGAVTAMGLGTGTFAAMAFDGALLTRPVGLAEQPVADALLLTYNGVYAAPPVTTVLSPNNDGVDDTQTFTYKLVRTSTVTATVVGPDRSTRTLVQGSQEPGPHTLTWDGASAVEGDWHFNITAVDTNGVSSTAQREFSLNETLGSLEATPAAATLSAGARESVAATFELARPARVTVTVEKRSGVVIATLVDKQLTPGPQSVSWNGRTWTGSLAFTGEYQLKVVAANSIGKATLVAPFTARRS